MNVSNRNAQIKSVKPARKENMDELNGAVRENMNAVDLPSRTEQSETGGNVILLQTAGDHVPAQVDGPALGMREHSKDALQQNREHKVLGTGLGDNDNRSISTGQESAIHPNSLHSPIQRPVRFKTAHAKSLRRGRFLAHRYCKSLNRECVSIADINPIGFANFLLTLKTEIKPDSWKKHERDFKLFLECQPHEDNEKALKILKENDCQAIVVEGIANPAASGNRNQKGLHNCRLEYMKRIAKPDFNALLNHFAAESKSYYRETVYHWLVAGISTGLRPIEWLTTTIETSEDPDNPTGLRTLLKVRQITSADDRSRGILRTMDISNFQSETITSVVAMVGFGAMCFEETPLSCCQNECSKRLSLACKHVFKNTGTAVRKSYSLLSLRQQFIANMKSLKDSREVTALAGHMHGASTIRNQATARNAWPRGEILDIPSIVTAPVLVGGQEHTAGTD